MTPCTDDISYRRSHQNRIYVVAPHEDTRLYFLIIIVIGNVNKLCNTFLVFRTKIEKQITYENFNQSALNVIFFRKQTMWYGTLPDVEIGNEYFMHQL